MRTPGRDPRDPELSQDAAGLGGVGGSAELFCQRPVVLRVPFEDPMAVGVGGERKSGASRDVAEEVQVGGRGFLFLKPRREDFAGGIVDRGV